MGPPELKAWMKKAIEEGHYTPEEIKVLKTQRLEVQEAVSASVFQPRKPAKDDPLTRLFEQLKETCPSPRPDSKNIAESTEPKKRRVGSIALPACRFRLCHACRPGWQERTWASLNRILEDEDYAKEPPEWEIRNRPISDAASVRTIGLPKPEPPPRPRNPLYPQLLLEDNDRSIESQNSISIRKASHSPPRSNVRPSVGRRIPLKRSARGSFSRGHDGALYFGNDSPLQHSMFNSPSLSSSVNADIQSTAHNDNIPLRTKSTEGKESDLASNDDVDSDGGVPLMKG